MNEGTAHSCKFKLSLYRKTMHALNLLWLSLFIQYECRSDTYVKTGHDWLTPHPSCYIVHGFHVTSY
jgi:hypothetical protein